jgi:hypothetical protein
LSTHLRLGLPSGLFSSGFQTNILYAFLVSPLRATCPAQLPALTYSNSALRLQSASVFRTVLIVNIEDLKLHNLRRGSSRVHLSELRTSWNYKLLVSVKLMLYFSILLHLVWLSSV